MGYELRRKEQDYRFLNSLGQFVLQEQGMAERVRAQRAREEQYRRRDAQRMAEQAAARAERQLRDAQRAWASRQQQGRR